MKTTSLFMALAATFAASVAASPSGEDRRALQGSVMAQPGGLMDRKMTSREKCRSSGLCGGKWKPEPKQKPKDGERRMARSSRYRACVNGFAGEYPCKNVDLLDFLSHAELGSSSAEGSDCWGWTSSDGREFALIGQTTGTAFAEINADGDMTYIGRLDTQTTSSLWRDIKVKGNYAYISAESSNHGLQIFDLRKLLTSGLASNPKVFSTSTDVTNFKGFGSAHNVIEGPSGKNYMVACGQTTCSGGPYFVDVTTPTSPKALGCYSADGYTHDAQIVIYNGPDTRFTGREIMFAYNEDTLTIVDVTNKSSFRQLARVGYTGSAYSHQGWLISSKQTHLLLDDELDEESRTSTASDGHTRTYVWNVKSLTNPVQEGIYRSPTTSIDHNQYVINGRSYQSNYASGLRIVNVTKVEAGGGAASMTEYGFFDVRPEDDVVDFYGSWSAFKFSGSKNILVNSIERGAFIVKEQS